MLVHNLGLGGLSRMPQEFMRGGSVDRGLMYRTLVENGVLREDQTREIDASVLRVASRDLVAVGDLRAAGLTRPLMDIGVTSFEYDRVTPVGPASQGMAILNLGDRDRVLFSRNAIPVPSTSSQFEMDAREKAAGRHGGGDSVDTINIEAHTRAVAEKLETTLVCGSDVVLGENGLFGYTNADCRHQLSFTGAVWGESGATPIADINAARQVLRDNGHNGPYIVYVGPNLDTTLDEDYKAESERTLRERILSMDGISQVKVLASLPDDNVLVVQMTSDVIQMATAQDITPVTWDLYGGLLTRWAIIHVGTFVIRCAWARNPAQCGGELPDLTTSTGIAHIA